MSKGGASGSTTSTTSIDPDLKKAYLRNIGQAQNVAGALKVREFAGFNPMYAAGEEQLVNTGLGGPGIRSVDQAASQTARAGSYQPQMITAATGGQAATFGGAQAGPAQTAGATGYSATDLNAAQANMADIDRYMNPYTQNVTKNALSDLDIARQKSLLQIAQQAGAAKAFGGSRQGVAEAQTNIGYGTQAGNLSAQLNEQAYNNAMAAQQQDIARQQQAAMQNAAQRTAASQFGAGASNTSYLANAAAKNQMAQYNAGNLQQAGLSNMAAQNQMAQYNAALKQQAALANQSTDLSGAQFRLGAANQLGNLGTAQQGLRMSGAQAVMQAGGARQQLDQARLDALRNIGMEKLGISSGALTAQLPNLGMTSTQPYYRNQASGALGGAAAGYQMFGGNPYAAAAGGLLGYFG
jgi:hypothetical protein